MADSTSPTEATPAPAPPSTSTSQEQPLPRIAIKYCTQCKWMLRAAYLAQELLSTFSTSLGEVSLIPSTGGIFTITISTTATTAATAPPTTTLWDRKLDGGFPETKELKSRVRNVIDPERDLGHVDRALKEERRKKDERALEQTTQAAVAGASGGAAAAAAAAAAGDGMQGCEECVGK